MKPVFEKETPRNIERARMVEFASPVVNIYETKDGYLLEAEMPGVGRDGLEITLEGSELTIAGRCNAESVGGGPLFRERLRLDFRRTFELDPTIDTAGMNAKMSQGLLTLTLPKSGQVKPHKIAVSE